MLLRQTLYAPVMGFLLLASAPVIAEDYGLSLDTIRFVCF